ncbi:pre-pilin like leader sequence [Pseudoxanthomonas kalamensis DSM 18571]|nr:pre-pilin like leader sequence [Pseudoxanthomonas kalamensis DSM 18571]
MISHIRQNDGFTLIELMVTVAVLAILVTLAVPSFTSLINSNRLTGQANSLVADLQLARSEAIRRNRTITVCRSTDGATCAGATGAWETWLTVIPGTSPLEVLRTGSVKAPVELSAGVDSVDFRSDGMARDAVGALLAANIVVCIPTTRPAENIRSVNIAAGSRVNVIPSSNAGACP